ncbi:MAG: hypothetical protein H7843_05640 [Nitrospirota bacterium]
MAAAIDTQKMFERLKGADLNDKAAKEISEILREVVANRLGTLDESLLLTEHGLTTVVNNIRIEIMRIDHRHRTEALKDKAEKYKSEANKWVAAILMTQIVAIAVMVRLIWLFGK